MHYGDDPTDTMANEGNAPSIAVPFRTKSLLLATFPWLSAIPMASGKLVDHIGDFPETRYTFVGHSFTNLWREWRKFIIDIIFVC